MLVLQASAGNRAVSEFLAPGAVIQRAPPPHLASSEIKYDTASPDIPGPDPGDTVATLKAALDVKRHTRPIDLGPNEVVLKGVAGEEVFVLNAVWSLAEHRRWAREFHVVIDVGRRPRGGGTPPKAEVSIRFDQQGNVVAELVQRGSIKPPQSGFPDSRAALTSEFKIAEIRDRGAHWSDLELDKVYTAFRRLPPADHDALAGVVLVRQRVVMIRGKAMAGEFETGKILAHGATAPSGEDRLILGDKAFAEGSGFEGDASGVVLPSFESIAHEAGHAIEKKTVREARVNVLIAEGSQNQASADLHALDVEMARAANVARARSRRYKRADRTAANRYMGSIVNVIGVLHGFAEPAKRKLPRFQAGVEAAMTARDKAKADLGAAEPDNPALTDFDDASAKEDDFLTAGKALAATDKKIADAETAKAAISATGGKSRRLQNFVDFVTANGILPLTDYAKENWPDRPQEFWAEAYSLWINDHAYLVASAKPLADWFDAGEYRKDTAPARP